MGLDGYANTSYPRGLKQVIGHVRAEAHNNELARPLSTWEPTRSSFTSANARPTEPGPRRRSCGSDPARRRDRKKPARSPRAAMERTARGDRRNDSRGRPARGRRRYGCRHDGPAHGDQQPRVSRPGQEAARRRDRSHSRARKNAGSPTWRCSRASGLADGTLVIFDTGGGSTQFTFGQGAASIASSASTWAPCATPSDFTSTRRCARRRARSRRRRHGRRSVGARRRRPA